MFLVSISMYVYFYLTSNSLSRLTDFGWRGVIGFIFISGVVSHVLLSGSLFLFLRVISVYAFRLLHLPRTTTVHERSRTSWSCRLK